MGLMHFERNALGRMSIERIRQSLCVHFFRRPIGLRIFPLRLVCIHYPGRTINIVLFNLVSQKKAVNAHVWRGKNDDELKCLSEIIRQSSTRESKSLYSANSCRPQWRGNKETDDQKERQLLDAHSPAPIFIQSRGPVNNIVFLTVILILHLFNYLPSSSPLYKSRAVQNFASHFTTCPSQATMRLTRQRSWLRICNNSFKINVYL